MTLCGSSISPFAATSCAAVYESSSGSRKIRQMCKTTDPESARPANRNGATGVPRKSLTGARRTGKYTRWQIAFSKLHHPDLARRPEIGNCGIRASERGRSTNLLSLSGGIAGRARNVVSDELSIWKLTRSYRSAFPPAESELYRPVRYFCV